MVGLICLSNKIRIQRNEIIVANSRYKNRIITGETDALKEVTYVCEMERKALIANPDGGGGVVVDKEKLLRSLKRKGIHLDTDARMKAAIFAPRALATIIEIMGNPDNNPTVRLDAAKIILDRAWGKPQQNLKAEVHTHSTVDLKKLSDKELDNLNVILGKATIIEVNPGDVGEGEEEQEDT